MTQVDAIVGAGGYGKPDDPLYPLVKDGPKAMLPVAGRPMIQWVLDALAASDRIGQVVVIGLPADFGLTCGGKQLDFIPSAGSIVDNARAGMRRVLELNPSAQYALWASADIPAARGEHVNWIVDACLQTDHDFYYTVIERAVMEKRYPESRRSYTYLKGATVCGGDMNMIATQMAQGVNPLWDKITAARKSVFKQASLIGFDTLALLALRQLTVERVVEAVGKRLGIRGRPIFCPYAEVGMDVDKPFQYEIVRKDLEKSQIPNPKSQNPIVNR